MLETQNQNDIRFNRHHLFFPEVDYPGVFQRRFRNHEGLVIPVLKTAHKDLHDLIYAPLKPTREMMQDCVEILDQADLSVLEANPLFALNAIVNYLDIYKLDDNKLADRAQKIQSHLGFQAVLLSNKTLVEVIQNEQRQRLDPDSAITHEMQWLTAERESEELLDIYTANPEAIHVRTVDGSVGKPSANAIHISKFLLSHQDSVASYFID
jgi:hypothetical protein